MATPAANARKWALLCLLAVCVPGFAPFLSATRCLAAAEYRPRLGQIIVSRNRASVLLFAEVEAPFNDELLSALRDGLPLSFEFEMQLVRERRLWPDRQLSLLRLTRRLEYDALKETYNFTSSSTGGGEARNTTQSLAEARRWMSSFEGIEVAPVSLLQERHRYYLQLRMTVSSTQEFFSRTIFFFGKGSRYETEWYRSPLFAIGGPKGS